MALKNIILQKLMPIFFDDWNTDKIRVLIYESDKDRINLIKKKEKLLENDLKKFIFRYVKNKWEYLHLAQKANVIFSYGISKYINDEHLKFIYIGQVGSDYTINNPSIYKIIHPPNFATGFIVEYIISLIILFERKLNFAIKLQNKKRWDQKYYFFKEKPRQINQLKIGILGVGNVGMNLAKKLKCLGCYVYGYDVYPKIVDHVDEFYHDENGLNKLLGESDYIVLTMSYRKENHHFLNEKRIEKINVRGCIINVARGKLIDEKALVEALKNKRIRGAILDVFEKEPLSSKSPLWKLDNVIITPHIAGNINFVFDKIVDNFFDTLKQEYSL